VDWVAIGSVASGGLGTACIGVLIKAVAARRTVSADAEVRLSVEARQWVEQFQEDALTARQDAREARVEAASARQEAERVHGDLQRIRAESMWLAKELQLLHEAIWRPGMDIERLRAMIRTDPPAAGVVGQPGGVLRRDDRPEQGLPG
jgi:hypothetical protein